MCGNAHTRVGADTTGTTFAAAWLHPHIYMCTYQQTISGQMSANKQSAARCGMVCAYSK
jgi:hypothetical protein